MVRTFRHADQIQYLAQLAALLDGVADTMQLERKADDLRYGLAWVQRRIRILEYRLDMARQGHPLRRIDLRTIDQHVP